MYGESGFGVALTKCFYCNEDSDIVLNTRLTKHMAEKVEGMHGKVINKNPCSKCEGYMKQGIIVISIDGEKSKGDMDNPYRMGGFYVMSADGVRKSDFHE